MCLISSQLQIMLEPRFSRRLKALANFTYAAQALLGEAFDCEVSVIGFTMVYLIKPSR